MSEVKVSNKKLIRIIVTILIIVIAVSAIFGGFIFIQKKNATIGGANELEVIMSKLDKVIELPPESPTLATVTDKYKLPGEPFYKNAENGDKVLVFSAAKKAILYRPTSGKIIEYVTVVTDQESGYGVESKKSSDVISSAKKEPVRIALFNATNISGLTKTVEAEIAKHLESEIEVVKRGDAKLEYDKTLVVDQTGAHSDVVSRIASLYKGVVGQFPDGEASISADIVVFIVK